MVLVDNFCDISAWERLLVFSGTEEKLVLHCIHSSLEVTDDQYIDNIEMLAIVNKAYPMSILNTRLGMVTNPLLVINIGLFKILLFCSCLKS